MGDILVFLIFFMPVLAVLGVLFYIFEKLFYLFVDEEKFDRWWEQRGCAQSGAARNSGKKEGCRGGQ